MDVNLSISSELTNLFLALLDLRKLQDEADRYAKEHIPAPIHRGKQKTVAISEPTPEPAANQIQDGAPSEETKSGAESAGEVIAAPKKEEPEQKAAITLPDLRKMISRVWDGGKNKLITDEALKKYGACNLTELAEDSYAEVYDELKKKAEELGL